WRPERDRSLRRVNLGVPRKRKIWTINVLIVHADQVATIPNVVVKPMLKCPIKCNKRAVEIHGQIVVGDGPQGVVIVDVIESKRTGRLAPQVYASQQGKRFVDLVGVENIFGIYVPAFALPDQALSEIWTHVKGVV